MRINVLGVGFDNVTMDEAVDRGMELLGSRKTQIRKKRTDFPPGQE